VHVIPFLDDLGPTFLPLSEMQLQVHANKAGCNFPPNNSSCCCCIVGQLVLVVAVVLTSLQLSDNAGIVESTMEKNFAGVMTGVVEYLAN
jgi:hypothetical protein